MRGISCHLPAGYGKDKIFSCSDAVAKAMDWYVNYKMQTQNSRFKTQDLKQMVYSDGARQTQHTTLNAQGAEFDVFQRGACPDCGSQMQYEEGCAKCVCGYSDCG